MGNVDYISRTWREQQLFASPIIRTVLTGIGPPLSFHKLFWLNAFIIVGAELCSPNALGISLKKLAKRLGLSIPHTREAVQYLKENGYLNARIYLNDHFYCRATKSKIKSLRLE